MKIFNNGPFVCFISGLLLALAFAPVFCLPALLSLTIFAYYVRSASTPYSAIINGFCFGTGFFTASLYWIAIGVSVYIDEFWWAMPFALFGLPMFLGCFIAISAVLSWYCKDSKYYGLCFSIIWVLIEWVKSWIFTGFPWNLIGYSLACYDELIQIASVFGPYGLSFFVVFIVVSFVDCISVMHDRKHAFNTLNSKFLFAICSIVLSVSFGIWRLNEYPTKFTDVNVRIVQPSIPQGDKWDESEIWKNLQKHVHFSNLNTGFKPDIIVWSESAVTVPYRIGEVKDLINGAIASPKTVLLTGGVSDNNIPGAEYELYCSMYGIGFNKKKLFEYHKAHLVPFGEYMPLGNILPVKKITAGMIDYTAGMSAQLFNIHGLIIRPLICYEAIFPSEVRIAKKYDVIFNITNDSWYGNSSGPYQHFQSVRMRAVENGVPIIRGGNNGISAIIDPVGRILSQTKLNHITVLDGVIPKRIMNNSTIYVAIGELGLLILIITMQVLMLTINKICRH